MRGSSNWNGTVTIWLFTIHYPWVRVNRRNWVHWRNCLSRLFHPWKSVRSNHDLYAFTVFCWCTWNTLSISTRSHEQRFTVIATGWVLAMLSVVIELSLYGTWQKTLMKPREISLLILFAYHHTHVVCEHSRYDVLSEFLLLPRLSLSALWVQHFSTNSANDFRRTVPADNKRPKSDIEDIVKWDRKDSPTYFDYGKLNWADVNINRWSRREEWTQD